MSPHILRSHAYILWVAGSQGSEIKSNDNCKNKIMDKRNMGRDDKMQNIIESIYAFIIILITIWS